ncbi:MAG: [protein-PII] uridylyltransferase [Acidimicrobiia bacterium]
MVFPARDQLLADTTLHGKAWCTALSAATDDWLCGIFDEAVAGDPRKVALVAVGGYGRGELAPGSDLDVLLLHDGRRDIATVAQQIWYPIWDTKLKLGHSVRSVKEALNLAADDLDTATSFLSVRHLTGDESLTRTLSDKGVAQWRKRAKRWLTTLAEGVEQRHRASGEVAFLLEPNLKDGRGGLRDVHSLNWARALDYLDFHLDEMEVAAAYDLLLGVRVELQRRTGKPSDILALQEQDGVAAALGYPNADVLMQRVSASARTIAWNSDEAWDRVRSTLRGLSATWEIRNDHPLASGLVLRDGEVHLESSASPSADPALALRAGAAAARRRVRIERKSLERLAAETPPMPDPWPVSASDALVDLLLCGHAAIPVFESLDQRGLMVKVLPEWANVRSKPQRNAYHRFTVDRHLLETAANAAELTAKVSRPDLLVLGALLHDIGKGVPGDHTVVGIEMVDELGPRLGLSHDDTSVLKQMVRHHLLLPDVATRRDLSDDSTIAFVAEQCGSTVVLELLDALTEADSLATGTAAWGTWKAELVSDLVGRVAHVLGGGEVHEVTWSLFPTPDVLARMGSLKVSIEPTADRLSVVAPDRPGLFSKIAGVLALHGLDVLDAHAYSDEQGMAASEFRVAPLETGDGLKWDRITADLDRALRGQLAIEARLAERAKAYRSVKRAYSAQPAVPSVTIDNDASSNATVVEVRAPDVMGVLYRITKAIAEMGLDIRHAKVQTLGHEVVDAFYVRDAAKLKVTDGFHLKELERAILFGLESR